MSLPSYQTAALVSPHPRINTTTIPLPYLQAFSYCKHKFIIPVAYSNSVIQVMSSWVAGTLETFFGRYQRMDNLKSHQRRNTSSRKFNNEPAASFCSALPCLSDYGFTPSSISGPSFTWPMLRTMISAGTRLVTFMASITYDSTYPYLSTEFRLRFRNGFWSHSSGCAYSRALLPSTRPLLPQIRDIGGWSTTFEDTQEAFGITVPDKANIHNCASELTTKSNVILVDFWNIGQSVETADTLNGIVGTGKNERHNEWADCQLRVGGRSYTSSGRMGGIGMGLLAVVKFAWLWRRKFLILHSDGVCLSCSIL